MVELRPATADDIDAIHAIEVASFSDPWRRASVRDIVLGGAARVIVASSGDLPVAGFGILVSAADEAEIMNVAVTPAARRAGVGRCIVTHLVATAAAAGARAVFLEVRQSNAAARALYVTLGFSEVARRRGYYSNPDEDAVVMRRDVTPAR
jgi:ribosomal-protein-alanine acetyltransferase